MLVYPYLYRVKSDPRKVILTRWKALQANHCTDVAGTGAAGIVRTAVCEFADVVTGVADTGDSV